MHNHRDSVPKALLSKVPEVTFALWLIKICSTTLGEMDGDVLSMTLKLGYAVSTAIFFGIFRVAVTTEIGAHLSPVPLLDGHRRDHYRRHHRVGLSHPHRWPRLLVAKVIMGG
jgi:hypothetical protein